jgi:hypothetical protein
MSLKAFHIFFITLSVLLATGCAVWGFVISSEPIFGYASAAVAIALVIYGISFVRKARRIIT